MPERPFVAAAFLLLRVGGELDSLLVHVPRAVCGKSSRFRFRNLTKPHNTQIATAALIGQPHCSRTTTIFTLSHGSQGRCVVLRSSSKQVEIISLERSYFPVCVSLRQLNFIQINGACATIRVTANSCCHHHHRSWTICPHSIPCCHLGPWSFLQHLIANQCEQ